MTSPKTSASGHDLTPPSADERQRLAASLSPEEWRVLLHQSAERAVEDGLVHR